MRKIFSLTFIFSVMLLIAGCGGGTETANNANAGTEEKTKTVEEAVIEVADTYGPAAEKKDGKFFEAGLTDDFGGINPNGFFDRAMVVKSISENPCDEKSDPPTDRKVTEIADGIALLTAKGSSQRTCDGKTTKMTRNTAGLWVKTGDTWKVAYYQVMPTSAPQEVKADEAAKPAAEEEAKKEEAKPAADEAKKEEAPLTPKFNSDDELARLLTGKEGDLWAAWTKKDTKPFEEALAADFQEMTMDGLKARADVLKQIAENKCEITGTSVSDTRAIKINDNLVLFLYKAAAKGKCGDEEAGTSYAASIWKKDGDNWKVVFHMETPVAKS